MSGVDGFERSRARRWAEMEATAAAAQEKIDALTERLEEEIYLRGAAEYAASQAQKNPHWGRVYWTTEDEPEDASALLDLSNGRVFLARNGGWIEAADEKRRPMVYMWPIDSGPFMAWDYEYHFSSVIRDLADHREQGQRIREIVRSETNTHGPLMEQPLDSVARMVGEFRKLRLSQYEEINSLRNRVNELSAGADS